MNTEIIIKKEDENDEFHSFFEDLNVEAPPDVELDEMESGEDEGTYYIDEDGNYYYKSNDTAKPEPFDPESINENETEFLIEETNDEKSKVSLRAHSQSKKTSDEGNSYLVIMQEDDSKQGNNIGNEIELEECVNDNKDPDYVDSKKKSTKKLSINNKKKQAETSTHICGYCDYSSTKRYLLARHLKSHSEERPYKCSICERGFKTHASLQNHVNTHTGVKPHRCSFCESSFTTSGELIRHIRYRHTHEKPHKCPECDYASVELSKLKRHIRCHTGERPYQCPHCTYASPDTFKLKRHLRIHTGEKPYECDICHARFTQSNSLKAHKLIHSVGDKPVFQCELCPTTCGRKTDLRIHVQKLHTSDQPLKCRRCDKLFPDRYTYKMHLRTHDGEKCFKCIFCPYASISAKHLESHMLIHTDQKPFKCEVCDQAFRQKQLLKRHHNLYHNKDYKPPQPKPKTHACPDCDRVFSHKGNLIRHMALHDPTSGVKEEAFALKVGRKKKIQYIEAENTTSINSDDVDNGISTEENNEFICENDIIEEDNQDVLPIKVEESDDNLISVQTGDSEFLVLQVIQVDKDETNDDNGYIFPELETNENQRFKSEIVDDENEELEINFE